MANSSDNPGVQLAPFQPHPWRVELRSLMEGAGVNASTVDAADVKFKEAIAADPVQVLSTEDMLMYAGRFSEFNEGYGLAWNNTSGETEVFKGTSHVEIVLNYVNRTGNDRMAPLADAVADLLFDAGVQDETFEAACEILGRVERVWVMGGAVPPSITDGKINEVTYEKLGQWPSFEAQSWACKVVRAVLDQHVQRPPSVAKQVE